jgi:hypothetical protein
MSFLHATGDQTKELEQTFPIKYQDHLAYQYQAGIILAIVGETEKAVDCLEAVRFSLRANLPPSDDPPSVHHGARSFSLAHSN